MDIDELPTVARQYYTGIGARRYKRASTRSGPGEALCFKSVAEERIRVRDAEIARLRATIMRLTDASEGATEL